MIVKQYENRGRILEDFQMYDLAAKQKKSDVSSQGTGNESLTPLLTSDSTYKVKDLIHNTQEIDKKILGIEGKTLFRKVESNQPIDLVEYAQQKVKEREDEVKFRRMSVDLDKAEARRAYERMLDTEAFRFQEAFQDSMLGLKALQDAVVKANGKSEIADWENAYMAENQLSSINHAEQEAWRRLVLGKLLGEVKALMKEGAKHSEISDYLMAKHGLERNEKFAERDAREVATDDKGNLDMAAYQNEYKENRKKDYSGLTKMFENKDVAEAERLAKAFVDALFAA